MAIIRVSVALLAELFSGLIGQWQRASYVIGSLVYSAVGGLTAAISINESAESGVQLLLVGYALIFGSGIAIANAARPLNAIGPLALLLLPIIVASLIEASPASLALAGILLLFGIGMRMVSQKVFAALVEKASSARQSALLAHHLREQAQTDAITGLANRSGFKMAAAARIADSKPGSQIALFWLDLHRFKEVNNTLGHKIGDKLLVEITSRLRARLSPDTVIARFGNDEFVFVGEFASRTEIERTASLLSADMATPMHLGGHRIKAGASIGISSGSAEGQDLDRLMQEADLALYHAKITDGLQICFFDMSITRDLVRRKEIEAELRGAIQRDELSIYFQPVIDLNSGKIRSFEALVRWFHPEKGELIPEEFIPIAEETGLIITLGNWIIRQAASACATWPSDVTLAVNLSPVQIRAPGAAMGILQALKEAKLDPSRLDMEVTESLFLEDNQSISSFMEELAAQGVGFSLDDFGTGFSSLHYLNKYPFRTIKVDRSFVSGPDLGRHNDAIIRAIVEMGSTLEMQIIAVGLETVEQVQTVRDAGCRLGQGFFFSRAVPDHLAAVMLAEQSDMRDLNQQSFRSLAG